MQLHFNSKQWYFVKIHAVLRINFDQMKIRSFYNMVSKWDETSWNLLRQIRARLVVTNARFGFICSFRILCEIHWKSLYTLVTVMVMVLGCYCNNNQSTAFRAYLCCMAMQEISADRQSSNVWISSLSHSYNVDIEIWFTVLKTLWEVRDFPDCLTNQVKEEKRKTKITNERTSFIWARTLLLQRQIVWPVFAFQYNIYENMKMLRFVMDSWNLNYWNMHLLGVLGYSRESIYRFRKTFKRFTLPFTFWNVEMWLWVLILGPSI